jgi:hypothetical protein
VNTNANSQCDRDELSSLHPDAVVLDLSWQASPTSSPSASACSGLAIQRQLSSASSRNVSGSALAPTGRCA